MHKSLCNNRVMPEWVLSADTFPPIQLYITLAMAKALFDVIAKEPVIVEKGGYAVIGHSRSGASPPCTSRQAGFRALATWPVRYHPAETIPYHSPAAVRAYAFQPLRCPEKKVLRPFTTSFPFRKVERRNVPPAPASLLRVRPPAAGSPRAWTPPGGAQPARAPAPPGTRPVQ